MSKSYGNATFWGFSPAIDLRKLAKKHEVDLDAKETLNVLLVGMSDGRHILNTMMGRDPSSPKINFYIFEASLQTMARELFLLNLLLSSSDEFGFQEKADMFLELYGNSLIRECTHNYLHIQCESLVRIIASQSCDKQFNKPFDFTNLKFRECDQLEDIFKFWQKKSDLGSKAFWVQRLRQHLGRRYDCRENAYDWDYNFHLRDKASIISWTEYKHWRETGVAFRRNANCYEIPNRTLLSKSNGNVNSYCGDIVNSPYLAFGITSHNTDLFKKMNGVHENSSTDVASYNLLSLVKHFDRRDQILGNEDRITFLSVEDYIRMSQRSKYHKKFDMVVLSNSMVHLLDDSMKKLFSEKGSLLVIESSRFMLDLKDEMHEEYKRKVEGMATRVNCNFDKTFDPLNHDYAVLKFIG